MRVAVIGARGFLGSHLVRRLEAEGMELQSVTSSAPGGIDPDSGRLSSGFRLAAGTEVVVYLAQSPRYRSGLAELHHLLAVNAVAPVEVARRAIEGGARRFLYASTGSVYAPSFEPLAETASLNRSAPYPLSKIHGEEALDLLRDELEIVHFRPFGLFGTGASSGLVRGLFASVRGEKPIFLEGRADGRDDGHGLRISLCYVEEAVGILTHLIREGGPPRVNLAGERAVGIREVADALGTIIGKTALCEEVERQRPGDLVADLTTLRRAIPGLTFTPLAEALRRTFAPAED